MTIIRQFTEYAEASLAKGAIAVMKAFPAPIASDIGGAIARLIGPLLPVSRVARTNLRIAFPDLPRQKHTRLIRAAWDNLGRTVAELPHLGTLTETTAGPGWQISGAEHLQTVAQAGGPVIFVSGHIGNWEVLPPAVARYGLPFASFYRAASNGSVNTLISQLRRDAMGRNVPNFAKGAPGARQALRHLAQGGHLGVLADQKMNDGIEAHLFGRPAMTASAAATFALRYGCPVITGYVRRLGPARFEVVVDSPIYPEPTGNRATDIATLTQRYNDRIEAAISANPGSWLWFHRRWPKETYRSSRRSA